MPGTAHRVAEIALFRRCTQSRVSARPVELEPHTFWTILERQWYSLYNPQTHEPAPSFHLHTTPSTPICLSLASFSMNSAHSSECWKSHWGEGSVLTDSPRDQSSMIHFSLRLVSHDRRWTYPRMERITLLRRSCLV